MALRAVELLQRQLRHDTEGSRSLLAIPAARRVVVLPSQIKLQRGADSTDCAVDIHEHRILYLLFTNKVA